MSRVTIVVFTLFYALCYSTFCFAFIFKDCGSTLGRFTEVSVSRCQTSDEKCVLKRGSNASISITFVSNEEISHVQAYVYGILNEIPIRFPSIKPDACQDPNDGIDCPLHKDQEYHYTTTIHVEKYYPKVSLDIKWEFTNDKNEKIVCFEFPSKLQ